METYLLEISRRILISEGVGWILRLEWSNDLMCNALYISFGLFLSQPPNSQVLYRHSPWKHPIYIE